MVTSGPGVLNALNALASAHLEGLPVLLLAGEAPRARRPGLATAEGLGARAIRITGPDQLTQFDLAELAKEGPIVLDIQMNREVRMLSSARYEVMQAAPQKKGSD